jgi:flagellar basal body-associated protein FliL
MIGRVNRESELGGSMKRLLLIVLAIAVALAMVAGVLALEKHPAAAAAVGGARRPL